MRDKKDIVEDWLPRYTGIPLACAADDDKLCN
jgi:hypothetical protein